MCVMTVIRNDAPFRRDLRARREALDLSRQQLAYQAGCSLSYLASLEAGAIPARSSAVLERVLLALDNLERGREGRVG